MLRWLRSVFFENWDLKIFALILSLILYRYVQGDQDRISMVSVKLLLKYDSNKYIQISKSIPTHLRVTLRGPESMLRSVDRRILRYTLDLSNAGAGPSQYELYMDQLRSLFPPEIRVIRISPSIIDVVLQKLEKRFLPVEVRTRNKPALGYKLIRPLQPYPAKVRVSGPIDTLQGVKKVLTEPIDLTGLKHDTIRVTNLIAPSPLIRFLDEHSVRVKLNFHQIQVRKEFKNIKVKLFNFLSSRKVHAVISPATVDILLYGPLAQLHLLHAKDITASVDGRYLANRGQGHYSVQLKINVPAPDITIVKAPARVDVELRYLLPLEKIPALDASDQSEPAIQPNFPSKKIRRKRKSRRYRLKRKLRRHRLKRRRKKRHYYKKRKRLKNYKKRKHFKPLKRKHLKSIKKHKIRRRRKYRPARHRKKKRVAHLPHQLKKLPRRALPKKSHAKRPTPIKKKKKRAKTREKSSLLRRKKGKKVSLLPAREEREAIRKREQIKGNVARFLKKEILLRGGKEGLTTRVKSKIFKKSEKLNSSGAVRVRAEPVGKRKAFGAAKRAVTSHHKK